jgi:hypothetical protein
MGLSLLVISLFTIPIFFSKVQDVVVRIVYFTVYLALELRSYTLPSTRSLEMSEEWVESEEKSVERHQPVSPEIKAAEEIANETQLDKILNIINALVSQPRKVLKLMKNDFSLKAKKEEGPGYIIKFRFKFLFFMLAALAATLTLFVPAVSTLGPGALCGLLMSWGVKYAIAQYATVVITGGFIYSLRTSAVGLLLLFNKARGESWEYQPLSSSSSTELVERLSSSTKNCYEQLECLPTRDTAPPRITFTQACPQCKASLVITTDTQQPHITVEKKQPIEKEEASAKGTGPLGNGMSRIANGQDPGTLPDNARENRSEKDLVELKP